MTIFKEIINLRSTDTQWVVQHTTGSYGDPDNILMGDAFELALGTWTGQGAREYVIDRMTGAIKWTPRFDFKCGPHKKLVDGKCANPYQDNVNLIVNDPQRDVGYVQGQLLNSIADLRAGKDIRFGVLGWRPGADTKVFRPGHYTNKPTVGAYDLLDLDSYLTWVRKP